MYIATPVTPRQRGGQFSGNLINFQTAQDPIQEFFGVERSEATEFLNRIRSLVFSPVHKLLRQLILSKY